MRRLPVIGIIILLLLQLTAFQVSALEKFGPHLSTNYDPKYLAPLRSKYNSAGTSDWVPLTILIPMTISKETLIAFLDVAKVQKFLPIIRVWNEGKKILSADIDKFLPTLESANGSVSGFPNDIFLVFGNEVNDGLNEWLDLLGVGRASPTEYANSLEEFITKVKSKNLTFKITNAPLNTSIPEVLPNIFDAINFWNQGPKRLLGQLDGLTFNTYELGMADSRATIKSWLWEYEQLGSPPKPLILTEFGFSPQATLRERENYVQSEYQAFKDGLRPDLEKVLAITPLLWMNGPIRIPIFSSLKTVSWIDPSELSTGAGNTSASPTPASYFQTVKGKKVSDTLKKINQSFLPFGVDLKKASNFLGEANTTDVLGESIDTTAVGENDPLADPAGRYAIGAAVQTPQQTPLSISSMIKNFFIGILGFFGFGNKKATEFAQIQLPQDVANQKLAESGGNDSEKLAQNLNSNTLGLTTSNKAMQKSVGLRQCGNLPPGACEGVKNAYEEMVTPTSSPPPSNCAPSMCALGTGLCDPGNLIKFWNDPILAKQASIICEKESGSRPDAKNYGCLRDDAASRTKEYSVGLFQINLWNDACVGTLINKVATPTPPFFSCDRGPNFDICTTQFVDPDVNINYAFRLSGEGTNWTPWSAAKVCGIVAGQADTFCEAPVIKNCPDPSEAINLPDSDFRLLDYQNGCIKPTMIVIHWSAAWTNVDATFNTLNAEKLACQLATDKDRTLQMQYLYKDQAQRGACVGGYNDHALNNEITGSFFDEVYNNPDDYNYNTLAIETEKSLASTCFLMKQYNIPITQIFGHFQLSDGKSDPGEGYLQYFLGKIDQKIKEGTCT